MPMEASGVIGAIGGIAELAKSAVDKQRGAKWAPSMEKLKSDIDRPLSAILTLNTIAHTMGAAGAGAQRP